MIRLNFRNQRGISLIELTIMLVVIGILAAVAMKSMTSSFEDIRRTKTEREMEMLANAIVGNPAVTADGWRSDFGYVGDVGAFPPNLTALAVNPGYSTWHGPYITPGLEQDTTGYRLDEWGVAYSYAGGLTISSTGHGTTLTKKIADASSDYLLNAYTGTITDSRDSVPGAVKKDSVSILVAIPNGSGSTAAKTYHPTASGSFRLDSLPVGRHPLTIVYASTHDTLSREITILPRNQTDAPVSYKFGSAAFSSGGGGSSSSSIILRPNGAGLVTLLGSSSGSNWQCVDEATSDEDASYVSRNGSVAMGDYYAMEDPGSPASAPTKVTLHARARMIGTHGSVTPMIIVGGVLPYLGTTSGLTTSYADYTSSWSSNPLTGSAWNWTAIRNLQIGLVLEGQSTTKPAYGTQVWLEVEY